MFRYSGSLSVSSCRASPNSVFVFGDNLVQKGKAGQACIRDEVNAFGIPTKRYPSMSDSSFFSDLPDEREAVRSALRSLFLMSKCRVLVFPANGVGTGLAKMKEKSPIIYNEMCEILLKHFGIINGFT